MTADCRGAFASMRVEEEEEDRELSGVEVVEAMA